MQGGQAAKEQQRVDTVFVLRDTLSVSVIKPPANTIAERIEPYSWIVGLIALYISFRALRWQVLVPREERRLANYRALVLDRGLAALEMFEAKGSLLLSKAVRDIDTYRSSKNSVGALLCATQFAVEYRELLNPFTFQILTAIRVWGPEPKWSRFWAEPTTQVNNALADLGDVIETVDQLRTTELPHSKSTERFHEMCRTLAAALVRLPECTR